MEYMRGSLKDVLKHWNSNLSEKQISAVLLSTVTGLDYLHSKAILHRDIKVFKR